MRFHTIAAAVLYVLVLCYRVRYITNKMLASCTVSLRVLENRSELIESFQKYLFENTKCLRNILECFRGEIETFCLSNFVLQNILLSATAHKSIQILFGSSYLHSFLLLN